jgi:hypothetical protein
VGLGAGYSCKKFRQSARRRQRCVSASGARAFSCCTFARVAMRAVRDAAVRSGRGAGRPQPHNPVGFPHAKSDSPALPVAEPPPDQSPGESERQSSTPELAGLNGAVRDAVNSDSAIPPVVPSVIDHATSTSRARWNERVSRRPEHTSRHARVVRVAAAKKPIWRLHWQARAEDEWCIVACRRANGEWCFFGCRAWRAQPVFYNVTR